MVNLPHHSGMGPDDDASSGHRPTNGRKSWGSILAIVLGVGLVVLFVVLHLTGTVGPGAH